MHRKVLVVDDDSDVAEEIVDALRRLETIPVMATDIQSAKYALQHGSIDLVIIDLRLRNEQGVDVLEAIADRSNTKVAFLSGLSEQLLRNVEESTREAGFHVVGRLTKPVNNHQLAKLLESAFTQPVPEHVNQLVPEPLSSDTIRRALHEGRIQPHFQPQYSLADGKLEGFEALARFVAPKGEVLHGLNTFAHFLDTGEFVWPIFASITQQAIKLFREYPDFAPNTRLSINIPARACGDERFPYDVITWCEDVALSPERVTLELTETTIDLTPQERLGLMKARVAGLNLSLDDFGSGAANLDRLELIPFNEVKLDAWLLLRTLDYAQGIDTLVETSNLLRKKNIRTVIEGVENSRLLERVGGGLFDVGQGYHFGRPLPAKEAFAVSSFCEEITRLRPAPRGNLPATNSDVLTNDERSFLNALWVEDSDEIEQELHIQLATPHAGENRPNKTLSCLIVEDDTEIAGEIRAALEPQGMACLIASTIVDAKRALRKDPTIKIVFLDLQLPDGHGQVILEELNENRRETMVNVFVLTAFGSPNVRNQALSLGALDYLEKPVTAEKLRSAATRIRDLEPAV